MPSSSKRVIRKRGGNQDVYKKRKEEFYRHKRCVDVSSLPEPAASEPPSVPVPVSVSVCERDNAVFQEFVRECFTGPGSEDVDSKWTNEAGVPLIPQINNTRLFRLLRVMPKGALLHAHFPAMVNWRLFLSTVLETPDLRGKVYYLKDPLALKRYIHSEPSLRRDPDLSVWSAPSGYSPNARNALTVFPGHPPPGWAPLDRVSAEAIADQMSSSHSWPALKVNKALPWSLVKNAAVFPLYFRLLLEEAIADGLQHVELKTNLGNLHVKRFPLNRASATISRANGLKGGFSYHEGSWLSHQDEIDAMIRVYEDPRFDLKRRISFRLLLGAHRSSSPIDLDKRFRTFMQIYHKNKDVVGGVDIFGHEDTGRKNEEYMKTLERMSSEVRYSDGGFVFSIHSGETSFVEYPVDENLLALTRLEAPVRVGHGISLWKYPELKEVYARTGQHVEVSPLSNVILGYVDRVANHPGLYFHASGIPISISSDDPSYFGYNYVSYDWFLAVLGWKLQLQDIVQICLNSIHASAKSRAAKGRLLRAYAKRMKEFVDALRILSVDAKASARTHTHVSGRNNSNSKGMTRGGNSSTRRK